MGWFIVRWLHVLAMALFVGGQLVVALAVVPVLGGGANPEAMRAIARRFGYASLGAFAVLIPTGVAMATHGHLWGDTALQVKLGLVVLVAVLLLWHVRRPTLHILEALVLVASLAIVWIGLYLANGYS